jgi:hypothetical protein
MMRARGWVGAPAVLAVLVLGTVAIPPAASAGAAPPTVTGLTPPAGHLDGGDTVTIVGRGLSTARRVHFGSATSTQLSHVSPRSLRVVTPAHAAGTVSVRVDTDAGRSGRSMQARFTYTDPPAHLNWSQPAEPDPASLADGYGQISCASSQLCLTFGNPKAATHTQLLMLQNGTWQWVALPASTAGPAVRADKGACPSTTFCMTAGWSGTSGDYHPTVWTWNGTSWSVSLVESSTRQDLDPSSLYHLDDDTADDRWSAVECAADDEYCIVEDSFGATTIYDNGSWMSPAVGFQPVSCATRTFCLIYTGSLAGFAVWDGTVLHPVGNPFGKNAFVTGASCAPPTFCLAEASSLNPERHQYATLDNDTWSTPQDMSVIGGLSCTSPASCWALGVDSVSGTGSLASHFDGTTWSAAQRTGTFEGFVAGLSCWSAAGCEATTSYAMFLTLKAPRWHATTPLKRTGHPTAVSCASRTMCVEVDATGNAATFDGTRWHPPVAIDNGRPLVAVSCLSTTVCMAADYIGYAVKFANGRWHTPRRVLPPNEFGAHLSCGSPRFCVAWSGDGDVAVYDGHWHKSRRLDRNHKGPLNDLSCTTGPFCIALALESDGTQVFTYDGRWHRIQGVVHKSKVLDDVSCTSRHFCLAVGSGIILRYDGSWHQRTWRPSVYEVYRLSCVRHFCAIAGEKQMWMLNDGALGIAIPKSAGLSMRSGPTCGTRHFCLVNTKKDAGTSLVAVDGGSWGDTRVPRSDNPAGYYGRLGDCTRDFCTMFTSLGEENHTRV